MSHLCRTHARRSEDRRLGGLQLRTVVARKQVTVAVERQHDARMAEPMLHRLGRKLEAAILATVYAPRRVEVPQAVEAAVLRLPARIDHASFDLHRPPGRAHEVG